MAESANKLRDLVSKIHEAIAAREANKVSGPTPPIIANAFRNDVDSTRQRMEALKISPENREALLDEQTLSQIDKYAANIENLLGTVKIPVGVAGPIQINGLYAQGSFLVPLATHEAALVASYHRGAMAINAVGGCTTAVLNEGISRSPGFAFENLVEAGHFAAWAIEQQDRFKEIAESTTTHGKLVDLKLTVEASNVYLNFVYHTGDAAGQNLVTIATEAVCKYISENTPVTPRHWFVEANLSGDKKASLLSFLGVRGRKTTAEIRLSAEVLKKRLRTTAVSMENFWRMSSMGGVLSGTVGVQGHFANGLAALFIACGQDAACVSEASIGTTRFEARDDGSLYAGVTLPNMIVGTIGGGTELPSQRACLELMGLAGNGKANAFAEVCAATVLAGELSIISAIAEGEFTRAHRILARQRRRNA